MPHLAYLKLGDIKGAAEIKAADRKDHIPILSFTHKQAAQYDVLGRLDLKDRRYYPAVFIKHLDYSTPLIRQAQADRVQFPTAQINFFHMPKSGPEKNYYTIKFTGVGIVSIKLVMPSTLDPLFTTTHEYEEVTFTYKTIEWEHTGPTAATVEQGQYSATNSKDDHPKLARFWYDEAQKLALSKVTDMAAEDVKARVEKQLRQLKGEPEPEK